MNQIKTVEEFRENILKDNVIVDFSAEWSTPSKMTDMIIEEIAEENDNITIIKVDVDRFRGIAKEYNIFNVPVIMFFQNGKVVKYKQGLLRKDELLDFINQ